MSVRSLPEINRLRLLLVALGLLVVWHLGGALAARAQGAARTKVNPQDGLTYVFVPAGAFRMGCSPMDMQCNPDEQPAHNVTIARGFWIGKTLVTQIAYRKVMGANPSYFQGNQRPVENVTWDNAQAYCSKVGMRLPTEAEWEYAARGGVPAASYAPQDKIAWYVVNSAGITHDVAQLQPNAYGLYDMLGSVWEWVADWYGPYAPADASDPKGAATGTLRVLRGGSWLNDVDGIRVSARVGDPSAYRHSDSGFRCVGQ